MLIWEKGKFNIMQVIEYHPRLFFGYEYPIKNTQRGSIYLDGKVFAHFWTVKDWSPEFNDLIAFNRDGLAIDMNFPTTKNYFKNLPELQNYIVEWLETNSK